MSDAAVKTADDDPLLYAIAVIENYQMDLRSARIYGHAFLQHGGMLDGPDGDYLPFPDGSSLAEFGFCQGRMYHNAVSRIKRMAGIHDDEVSE